jgi:hypothetical protein
MFTVVQGGQLVCEHCNGSVEPIAQMKAAGWGSPEVWEYQCVRCGGFYFCSVNPADVPLVPQLE